MAIVKVQRPLNVLPEPTGEAPCLVYPKSRRAWVQQPVPNDVMKVLLARPGGKAFFEGTWSAAAQQWMLGKQVADQDW